MAKIKADALVRYAVNAVGGGYCWGADGQVCSPAVRQELANRTSNTETRNNLLGLCAKWDGKKIWDCSGLFRGAWRTLLKYRSGGATGIYNKWCFMTGTINTLPDEPGIAVFRGTPNNMEHVGLYIGGGEVIDARGSAKGVVRGTLESYGRWTHWGRLEDVDYSESEAESPATNKVKWSATVRTKTGNGISLWDTPLKSASVQRVPEGAAVDVLYEAGNGFVLASYDGVLGYADAGYLVRESGSAGDSDANTDRLEALEERVSALEKILGVTECEDCKIGG